MATKSVNPDDPGQGQVFFTDLLLARRGLTDFQAFTLVEAMNHEWETGHPPQDATVWNCLARPVNGRQKTELAALVGLYDTHSLVRKMRARRADRLEEKQNRIAAAQSRNLDSEEGGSAPKVEVRTLKKTEVRSQTSGEDKPNDNNNDTRQLSDNSPPSSSSASSSKKKPSAKALGGGKPPAPPDPRKDHPALKACQDVARLCPPKDMWDRLIGAIGDTPDEGYLLACRVEWIERGYNRVSWKWATEWYPSGIPGSGSQARGQPPTKAQQIETANEQEGQEFLRRMAAKRQQAAAIDAEVIQ